MDRSNKLNSSIGQMREYVAEGNISRAVEKLSEIPLKDQSLAQEWLLGSCKLVHIRKRNGVFLLMQAFKEGDWYVWRVCGEVSGEVSKVLYRMSVGGSPLKSHVGYCWASREGILGLQDLSVSHMENITRMLSKSEAPLHQKLLQKAVFAEEIKVRSGESVSVLRSHEDLSSETSVEVYTNDDRRHIEVRVHVKGLATQTLSLYPFLKPSAWDVRCVTQARFVRLSGDEKVRESLRAYLKREVYSLGLSLVESQKGISYGPERGLLRGVSFPQSDPEDHYEYTSYLNGLCVYKSL